MPRPAADRFCPDVAEGVNSGPFLLPVKRHSSPVVQPNSFRASSDFQVLK